MKRALRWLGAALAVLVAVLVARGMTATSRQITAPPADSLPAFELDAACERLSAVVRLRTVTDSGGGAFAELHDMLADRLPGVRALERRDFPLGALYTWKGSDPTLPPALFLAHADVVPVEAPQTWTHPPFGGVRADGLIWGRGALDDKASLMALLEAASALRSEGFTPRRTLMFAFGHDEETRGQGARQIAAYLAEQGVRAALVIDEGGVITDGLVPGAPGPVALVGIAEKDAINVRLTARDVGGHGSMPPPHTAAGRVGRAVALLEANPFPLRITPAAAAFMDWLAPELPFGARLVLRNRWLFGSLVRARYGATPKTAAQMRTTTAVTMLSGGPKANVLPKQATATINFRLLPGATHEQVLARARQVIGDPQVEVELIESVSAERAFVTDPDGPAFATVQRAIARVFPEVITVPFLVVAMTDARHYAAVSDQILRFAPLRLTAGDTDRIHGTDERISEADYGAMVRFYAQLMRGLQDAS